MTRPERAPREPRPSASPGFWRHPLHYLLVAAPLAIALERTGADPLWVFIASGVAIVPLAGIMGEATETLADRLGPGGGGLLNASFGNAAELIIALMVLRRGPAMYPLVKASITGSIIGNVLLVLGASILAGGIRHKRQTFHPTAASMGATLLALATIGLIVPTIFYHIASGSSGLSRVESRKLETLSEEIAVILAVIYLLSLAFALRTHRDLFAGLDTPARAHATTGDAPRLAPALAWLIGSTIGVAILSELLAGSVEPAAEALGMSKVFVGVIVVAIIGNAAEHSTAVLMALRDKLELSMQIAVGSGTQIALFVTPVLVFASMFMGHERALDLHFTLMEIVSLLLSVGVLALVCFDGETHWMEGVMLIGVYLIFALAFYHLPAGSW